MFLEEFVKINTNMKMRIIKSEKCRTKYNDCECYVKYTNFKDDLRVYKRLYCQKELTKI